MRIARACLYLDTGIDLRDVRSVEIAQNPASSSSGAETWIVSFALAHNDIEVKVSVPDGEPEHTMVYIDHHSAGRLPQSPPTGAAGTDIESRDRS